MSPLVRWYSCAKPIVGEPIDLPPKLRIDELGINKVDGNGDMVLEFFVRKPPAYAVYRTGNRVAVQFSDDPTESDRQRKAFAPLNPVRGEINGLIDGWRRRPEHDRRFRRAMRFDRLVADALVVAFEDDVPDAAIILGRIKQDIQDMRTAWARFQYLIASFLTAVFAIGLMHLNETAPNHGASLWAAAAAGAVGAFFSVAIGIRGRTVLPDLLWLANTMDAILRMIIGIIGGAVLMAAINLKLVRIGLGNAEAISADSGANAWLGVLMIGFLAGFSERLVPDLLAKAATKPVDPMPPRRDAERQPAQGQAKEPPVTVAEPDDASAEDALDHCLCTIGALDSQTTPDEDLPGASGGVAK